MIIQFILSSIFFLLFLSVGNVCCCEANVGLGLQLYSFVMIMLVENIILPYGNFNYILLPRVQISVYIGVVSKNWRNRLSCEKQLMLWSINKGQELI